MAIKECNENSEITRMERIDPVTRAKMERCANFLVRMVNKYGKEVLEEIDAVEKVKTKQ